MFGPCRLLRVRCLDPSVSLRFLLRVDDPDKMSDPALCTWLSQLQSRLLHRFYVRFNRVRCPKHEQDARLPAHQNLVSLH
jgi:hypothetical protein